MKRAQRGGGPWGRAEGEHPEGADAPKSEGREKHSEKERENGTGKESEEVREKVEETKGVRGGDVRACGKYSEHKPKVKQKVQPVSSGDRAGRHADDERYLLEARFVVSRYAGL